MSSLSKYFVNYKYFNILKPPGWKINNGEKLFLLEKWSLRWFFHPKLTYRKDWADGDHQDDDHADDHDEENDDDHHDACHHHEPEFQIQDAEPSLRHRRQIAGHWTRTLKNSLKNCGFLSTLLLFHMSVRPTKAWHTDNDDDTDVWDHLTGSSPIQMVPSQFKPESTLFSFLSWSAVTIVNHYNHHHVWWNSMNTSW